MNETDTHDLEKGRVSEVTVGSPAAVVPTEEGSQAEAQAEASEEQSKLRELVEQATGLRPKEIEKRPEAEAEAIARITSDQIKVMRQVSAKRANQGEPIANQLGNVLIKVFCGLKAMFSFSGRGKQSCELVGHQCANCGKKFVASASMAMPDEVR